jgi:nifR3 family TIM-barrel protein
MDGITDRAFRKAIRKVSKQVLLFSEFTSVYKFDDESQWKDRLGFCDEDAPYYVQLFGDDPARFAEAAKKLEDFGVTGVDINMGCPSRNIVKVGQGAGMMKNPDLAKKVVEKTAEAVKIPVSVKTRLGWENNDQLISFATGLESAGAKMLIVHGRTFKQAYKGQANWEPIYQLKKNLSVPLIGNGDILDYDQGMEKMQNLDGFMIGRGTFGNPWAFLPKKERDSVTLQEKLELLEQHFNWLLEYKNERRALLEIRKHLTGYLKGVENSREFRAQLMSVDTSEEFLNMLKANKFA